MKEEPPAVRKNYIYSMITMAANGLFMIVSLPYVARVLGPEGTGKVGFAASIAQYFVMIAGFGMPLYGIREIAKARDDNARLGKVFSELFLLGSAANLVSLALYVCLFLFSDKIRHERALFIIFGAQVMLNMFSIEWLYQGLERFRYIMVRNAVVKAVTLGLIFWIIRMPGDYAAFAALTVFASCGGSVWNSIKSCRHVHFTLQGLDVRRHFKALSIFYGTAIVGSASATFDTAVLGFCSSDANVGFYTLGKKVIAIAVTFIAAFGSVSAPRLSHHLEKERGDEYRRLAERAIRLVYLFSLPVVVGLVMLSSEIMITLGGEAFLPGSVSLKLIAPTTLLTSLNVFFAFQVLVPHHRERGMVIANLCGAFASLALNLALVPRYHQNGSALSLIISEALILAVLIAYVRRHIPHALSLGTDISNYAIGSLLAGICIMAVKLMTHDPIAVVAYSLVVSPVVYIAFLAVRRDASLAGLLRRRS